MFRYGSEICLKRYRPNGIEAIMKMTAKLIKLMITFKYNLSPKTSVYPKFSDVVNKRKACLIYFMAKSEMPTELMMTKLTNKIMK